MTYPIQYIKKIPHAVETMHSNSSKFWQRIALVSVTAVIALIGGCGGGSSGSSMGSLNMSLTDAPACGYDQVNVTVQKVRVNASATATDTDAGWNEIVLNPAQRFNLLTLSNGVLANLGQLPLAAGHYSQIRLVLASNGNSSPYANSVVPTNGSEIALTTPSALQTGIKLNADITIAANQMADFVLDFNACKSVVAAGASGNYLLKPVVAITPNFISGVVGYVDSSIANGNTLVTLQQGGVIIKATAPDSTGKFVLEPVAPGTSYDVVITAPNSAATVITGVPVNNQLVTNLNTSTNRLALVPAQSGTAAGTITTTPSGSTIDATVVATQQLSNSDTVNIADATANSVTGTYSLTLPATAPQVATYSATATTYNFVPDAVGARYTLSATSGNVVRTTPITMTSGGTITSNFAF